MTLSDTLPNDRKLFYVCDKKKKKKKIREVDQYKNTKIAF